MTLEYRKKRCGNNTLLYVLIGIVFLGCIAWWTMYTIKENHLQDDPMLWQLKGMIEPLHPKFKTLKLYKGAKSYTINKEKIYMCLKDEKGEYYPTNTLVYVLLHEAAHYLNRDDIGHTEKFHTIFQDLIDKATELGIYNPSLPPEENYCMYSG